MNNKTIIKLIFKAFLAFIETLIDVLQDEIGAGEETEEEHTDKLKPQRFYFPMEYLRITQHENVGTHTKTLAMDFGGKDIDKDICYAPCDMIVKRVRENANGEIYFESVFPVSFADGTIDYARLLMIHDNNTYKLKVGDVIKQWQPFYREGGMYKGNPTYYANHVHIEAGKGKWKNTNQTQTSAGTWTIENPEHLYNLFWLKHNTINLNDIEHKFRFEP